MSNSIERRLFVTLGAFVLAITLMWAALALVLAYIVEDEIIDRVLASQSQLVVDRWREHGELVSPVLPQLSILSSIDQAPIEVRDLIAGQGQRGEIFTADKTHYHYRWIALAKRNPVLLLAEVSPWLVVSYMSHALLLFIAVGFVVALLLALLAAFAIARITTRPVRELTSAIASEPRTSPMPHQGDQDEVGFLATTIDRALVDLQQALDREVSFTRDISHELRTPLTTMKNAITLLPGEIDRLPQGRQLRASCEEMEQLISSLLALARASSMSMAALPIRALIEELLLKRRAEIAERGFDIEIDVPDRLRVNGNRHLTELLLGNLLDNVIYYASPASLQIRCGGAQQLLISNPQGLVDSAPHPQSMGHGLSLVQRLASAQGWTVTPSSESGIFSVTIDCANNPADFTPL